MNVPLFRFEYQNEFDDNLANCTGRGVYIPGLPLPFVLFLDWTKCPTESERGFQVTCRSAEQDGIWGVTRWIDGPPPGLPGPDTPYRIERLVLK